MLVTHSLTDWLTNSCLVNLIDVTLACKDANPKLIEVVTVADVVDADDNVVAGSPNWLWAGVGVCATVCGEDEERAVEGSAQDQPPLHGDASHVVVGVQTLREVRGGSRLSISFFWRINLHLDKFLSGKIHASCCCSVLGLWLSWQPKDANKMRDSADYFSSIEREILHICTTWSMS